MTQPLSTEKLDALFTEVQSECAQHDKGVRGFAQNRSTVMRRALAFISIALLIVLSVSTMSLVPYQTMNPMWFAVLIAYALLLAMTVRVAIRPLYVPTLSQHTTFLYATLALTATIAAAWLPAQIQETFTQNHAHQHALQTVGSAWRHAIPCMGTGLLMLSLIHI